MLNFIIFGIKVKFTFMFFGILTIFLLTDKTGIAFWGLISAMIHEAGHVVIFLFVKHKPSEIIFAATGIKLIKNTKIISYGKEALILIAGSGINFITAFFLFIHPDQYVRQIAVLNIITGIFNLLPVWTLDGGKILYLITENIFGQRKSFIICRTVSLAVCAVLIYFSFILFLQNGNFTLLLVSIFITISIK